MWPESFPASEVKIVRQSQSHVELLVCECECECEYSAVLLSPPVKFYSSCKTLKGIVYDKGAAQGQTDAAGGEAAAEAALPRRQLCGRQEKMPD